MNSNFKTSLFSAICIALGAFFSAVTMCFKQTVTDTVLHIEETIEISDTLVDLKGTTRHDKDEEISLT